MIFGICDLELEIYIFGLCAIYFISRYIQITLPMRLN
jgi:hypothetical protein